MINGAQLGEKAYRISQLSKRYMMEIILVILVLLLIVTAPGFFTLGNILNIFRNVAITGVISFAMTMVIIGGEIDLSVGSSIALSAVITSTVTGKLAEAGVMPMESAVWIGMLVAIIVGMGIGLFNGFVRTKFNIPSFIATLAMLNVLYGIAAIISKGFPVHHTSLMVQLDRCRSFLQPHTGSRPLAHHRLHIRVCDHEQDETRSRDLCGGRKPRSSTTVGNQCQVREDHHPHDRTDVRRLQRNHPFGPGDVGFLDLRKRV